MSTLGDLGDFRPAVPVAASPKRSSGGGCVECRDPDEVVDGGGRLEPGSVAVVADVAELAPGSDCFDPAEGFLDPFSDPLADVVAGVAGDAPVDRGAAVRVVLCDVGREPASRTSATNCLVS